MTDSVKGFATLGKQFHSLSPNLSLHKLNIFLFLLKTLPLVWSQMFLRLLRRVKDQYRCLVLNNKICHGVSGTYWKEHTGKKANPYISCYSF